MWVPGESFKIGHSQVVSYTHVNNGLQVLLCPVPGAAVCGYMRAVRAGSADEDGMTPMGAAHFIEHMSFRIQKGKIWSLASKGDVINAETNMDSTRFYVVHLPHQTPQTIEIDSQRFRQAAVPAEKIPIERNAVLNELERGQQAGNKMFRTTSSVAILEHPYHHSTIGTKMDVSRTSARDMAHYRETYYTPNNTTLIFAGAFDPKSVLDHVNTHFGEMPKGPELGNVHTVEPPQEGRRAVHLNISAPCPMICMAFPQPKGATKDSLIMKCISRLTWYNEEGRAKPLVSDGTLHDVSTYSPRQLDPYLWFFHGTMEQTSKHIRNSVEEKMLHILQSFATHPVTKDELETIKMSLRDDWNRSTESVTDIMNELGRSVSMGCWTDFGDRHHTLDTITPADIQEMAEHAFAQEKMTVTHVIPTKIHNHKFNLRPMVSQTTLSPPAHMLTGLQGEASTWEVRPLSAATNILHVPRANYVRATLSARYSPEEHDMASLLVSNLGYGKRGTETTTSALTRLHSERRFSHDHEFVHMSMEMPLTTDILKRAGSIMFSQDWSRPEFTEEHVELQKRHMLSELRSLSSNQQHQTKSHFIQAAFENTQYHECIDERVKRIQSWSAKDLRQFHKKWLSRDNVYCTIVAPTTGAAATLGEIFPAHDTVPKTTLAWNSLPRRSLTKHVPLAGYGSAQMMMGQTIPIQEEHKDSIALTTAASILGGGMTARLMHVVREQKGLGTYGIYAQMQHISPSTDSLFCIQGTFSPGSLKEGLECTRALVQEWQAKGVTEKELEDAKDNMIGKRVIASDTVDQLHGMVLRSILQRKDPKKAFEKFCSDVRALTVDEVNTALRKWIDPSKMIEIVVGPLGPTK